MNKIKLTLQCLCGTALVLGLGFAVNYGLALTGKPMAINLMQSIGVM